jgi:hypothetical protein
MRGGWRRRRRRAAMAGNGESSVGEGVVRASVVEGSW